MTRTLLLTGLRDLVRRPLHTGLMVLGVALGVAVVIAIDLANESARRGFMRSSAAVTGRTTHQVRGGPGGLDQDLLLRIRTEAGVRARAPVVEGYTMTLDGERQPLRVLGIDPLSEGPFRDLVGGGAVAEPGLVRFFTDRFSVIVGASLAARYGLRPGSPLRVQVQDRLETLEVIGIVHGRDPDEEAALESLALMDVGAAQALFGLAGRLKGLPPPFRS